MEYLLGSLSEPEKSRLEAEFFVNDASFEELEIAEDELIDDYVREELSADERRKFRAKLMTSPRIVERVNFAKAFAEKTAAALSQTPEANPETEFSRAQPAAKTKKGWWEKYFVAQPAFRTAFAAGALIILGGAVLLIGSLRLRAESNRLVAEREAVQRQKEELARQSAEERAKNEQLAADLQRQQEQLAAAQKQYEDQRRNQKPETPGFTVGSIVPLLLFPGGTRSVGSEGVAADSDLLLQPETSAAALTLGLERNEYRSYRVSVRRADGKVVFSRAGLTPRSEPSGDFLSISVPARSLTPNDYTVIVAGKSAAGQYEQVSSGYRFRVPTKAR
jgi:anti-sigma factor RsiW